MGDHRAGVLSSLTPYPLSHCDGRGEHGRLLSRRSGRGVLWAAVGGEGAPNREYSPPVRPSCLTWGRRRRMVVSSASRLRRARRMNLALRREDWSTRIAMLQVRPHRNRFSVIDLAWLAALLGMLACPIQYRGGAELPHDHAIFQLIYDAAHGSIDHHHDGDPASDDD